MGADPENAGQPDALEFLAGGGAMGALIRVQDWAATSLGPAEGWPRSLQNALRLLLAAPYPMAIAWGSEPACASVMATASRRSPRMSGIR